MSREDIKDSIEERKDEIKKTISGLNQEINLSYVSITRSMLGYKYISKEERGLWVDQIMSMRG